MAPKLYYIPASPPCRAVLMVAKAIGLELELEVVEREQLRTEEMLEVHSDTLRIRNKLTETPSTLNPQHTVPILVDPEEDFSIWDSHAIAIYLVGQYAEDDSLYPKDDIKQIAVINQRLQFDNILLDRCNTAIRPVISGIQDEVTEEDKDNLVEALGLLEIFLKDKDWMAGDSLTIADLTILALIATIEEVFVPIDPERFPKLADWLGRAKELPYFEECNREGIDNFKEFIKHEVPIV